VGAEPRRLAGLLLTRTLDDKRGLDGLTDGNGGLAEYLALAENDRLLARAIARTALARKGQLDLAIRRVSDRPLPKGARHLLHTLYVAATQILFMDVPDSAAVNIAVNLVARDQRSKRFKGFANAILRRLSAEKAEIEPKLRSDKLNTPKWMYANWTEAYGHEAARAIATHHAKIHAGQAPLDLSVKGDAEEFARQVDGAYALPNGTVRLPKPTDVRGLPGFDDGAFWVQDAAARLPAQLLAPQAGERIADLCAAPGGKTAQLASTGAAITSVEVVSSRADRLRENLQRLKLESVTKIVEADMFLWQPPAAFDAILLDAPCSSTGTIRRHPDVLWTKEKEDIAALADLQFRMVQRASEMLAPGGRLVFSNCSLDSTEGEDLHKRIVEQCPDLSLVPVTPDEILGFEHVLKDNGTLRSLPFAGPRSADGEGDRLGCDGFFCARYQKV
jgi:16S rRNA (cytosine967-C5)-methyltransferase